MFGASGGGPIMKNKLFFFVDYQGSRFNRPANVSTLTVMTPAERQGDFSQLLTPAQRAALQPILGGRERQSGCRSRTTRFR